MEELECRICYQYLPEEDFYYSKQYPKKRFNRSYWCIECFREKNRAYKQETKEPVETDYQIFLRVMTALGYDISDLENNSIHSQFMSKYGDKLKPKPELTPKQRRQLSYQRQIEKKKKGGY